MRSKDEINSDVKLSVFVPLVIFWNEYLTYLLEK